MGFETNKTICVGASTVNTMENNGNAGIKPVFTVARVFRSNRKRKLSSRVVRLKARTLVLVVVKNSGWSTSNHLPMGGFVTEKLKRLYSNNEKLMSFHWNAIVLARHVDAYETKIIGHVRKHYADTPVSISHRFVCDVHALERRYRNECVSESPCRELRTTPGVDVKKITRFGRRITFVCFLPSCYSPFSCRPGQKHGAVPKGCFATGFSFRGLPRPRLFRDTRTHFRGRCADTLRSHQRDQPAVFLPNAVAESNAKSAVWIPRTFDGPINLKLSVE